MGIMGLFRKTPQNESPATTIQSFDIGQQAEEKAKENKKRDDASIRSANGLTVGEILLLHYCLQGAYPNPKGGYPQFWHSDYGMDHVDAILKSLEKREFIRFALPKELVSTLKTDQLKEILSEIGQKTTGKKNDLIDRINQYAEDTVLRKYFTETKYTLTGKGKKELSDNEYVPYLHAHKKYGITVWEANQVIRKNPDRLYRDLIWGIFNQHQQEAMSPWNQGIYRNTKYSMAEFLMDEKRYSDAISLLGGVCYMDVVLHPDYIPYDQFTDLLAPDAVTRLKKCKEEAKLSKDDLFQRLQKEFSRYNYPGRTINISDQDLAGLLVAAIENEL